MYRGNKHVSGAGLGHLAEWGAWMRAIRFHRAGGPDVLTLDDVPEPLPGRGEILVRVEAAGVNFADVLRRRGDPYPESTPLPFTPGAEIAGTVAALGPEVMEPAIGTPVFAASRTGGYAQLAVVPAASVIPLPAGIDAIGAAALVIQGLTALFAMRDGGRLGTGETVFVEAAAGGVGSFAVQLAKLLGAGMVIGGASTRIKRDHVLSLGADAAIDYAAPGWPDQLKALTGGRGADVVLEMTGGDTLRRALDAMSDFGRMVVYGLASAESAQVDPQQLVNRNQTVTGFYIAGFFARPVVVASALTELVGHVQAGRVTPQIGAVLPLAEAAAAHRMLETRASTGKLILRPWA